MATKRCSWVSINNLLMLQYHDREWGVPVHDDRKHFEFLVLEAAQAGLSWSIVLKKREGYRRAFSEFDPERVARYTENRIEKLTLNPAIIRNRMKIKAAVRNAQRFSQFRKSWEVLTPIAGGSSMDDPRSTVGRQCGRFRRPQVNRTRLARISNAGDSASLVRPSSMRTCRRSAW